MSIDRDTNYNITLLPSMVVGAYEWIGMEEMCVDTALLDYSLYLGRAPSLSTTFIRVKAV